MSNGRQWAVAISAVMTVAFGTALYVKIRPEIDLVQAGSRAPNFDAVDMTTQHHVGLTAYRGKVILLNIWATWCPPCRVEMPSLEQLQSHFPKDSFEVVAVSVDRDGDSVVSAFARQLGLTFTILHNQPGDIQTIYQTTGVPESFVIDRDGTIIKKVIGAEEWDGPVNETLVRRLLDAR